MFLVGSPKREGEHGCIVDAIVAVIKPDEEQNFCEQEKCSKEVKKNKKKKK